MKVHKISICGSPYVGKTTIIRMLKNYDNKHLFTPKDRKVGPNIVLNMQFNNKNLQISARSGAYSEQEDTIQNVIQDANVIIYVLYPCKSNGSHLNFNDDYHKNYLEIHSRISKQTHTHWTNIPWIIVLNKLDLAHNIPPEADIFPRELVDGMIHCVATQGSGIDDLWSNITKVAQI